MALSVTTDDSNAELVQQLLAQISALSAENEELQERVNEQTAQIPTEMDPREQSLVARELAVTTRADQLDTREEALATRASTLDLELQQAREEADRRVETATRDGDLRVQDAHRYGKYMGYAAVFLTLFVVQAVQAVSDYYFSDEG